MQPLPADYVFDSDRTQPGRQVSSTRKETAQFLNTGGAIELLYKICVMCENYAAAH